MDALTIWPEWVWAIENLGKDVENCGWKLPKSQINIPVFIHAGVNIGGTSAADGLRRLMDTAESAGWVVKDKSEDHRVVCKIQGERNPTKIVFSRAGKEKILNIHSLVRGALVAVARFDNGWPVKKGSPEYHLDAWAHDGLYHWRIKDLWPLDVPVRCSGRQRFWRVPDDVASRAMAYGGMVPGTFPAFGG